MSVRVVAVVLVTFCLSTVLLAGDSLVIVGAGFTGSWDTNLVLANPGHAPIWTWIGQIPRVPGCLHCPGWDRLVPPDGVTTTTAEETVSPFGSPGVRTLYIDSYIFDENGTIVTGSDQPTVTARVVNRSRPSQAIELPVVRYSTIQAMNPAVLAFPSARRTTDSHSNLIVADVSREMSSGLSILVEAFSAAGERLGAANLSIPPGGGFSAGNTLFLVDVLAQLGVAALDGGQIRVTKTGGSGLMWGLLATLSDDGRISVSPGLNP
jgi:hypothetical protein